MKYLCTWLLVSVSFSLWAQLVLTRSDYGNPGDRILYAVDTPIFYALHTGLPGENRSWNFMTSQSPRRYDSSVFMAAASDPQAPGVPVNLLMRTVAWGDVYQEVTDNYVKSIRHFPQYLVKGVVLKTMSFPLSYGTKFSDSAEVTVRGTFADFGIQPIPPFDSIRIEATIRMRSECDGSGLLTLPDSTSHNTLRVQNIIDIHGDVYGHFSLGWTPLPLFSQDQQIVSYQWYGEQSRSYLANVTVDSLGRMTSLAYRITSLPRGLNAAILSCSPDSVVRGEKITVTIKGRNTTFSEVDESDLYFSSFFIDTFNVVDDTTITATIHSASNASPGYAYLRVWDPYAGPLYLWEAVRVLPPLFPPSIKSISPGFGEKGARINVKIFGTRTHFTQGTNTISFQPYQSGSGRVDVNSFSVENDSVIICSVIIDTSGSQATYAVSVGNSIDGYMSLPNAFTSVVSSVHEQSPGVLSLYPNPANSSFTIALAYPVADGAFTINDMTGRVCITAKPDGPETTVDISQLDAGIYLFRFSAAGGEIVRRLVIQH